MIRIALVALCGLTSPALAQACAPYSAVSKGLAPWLVEELDPVAEQAIDHLNRVIRNE